MSSGQAPEGPGELLLPHPCAPIHCSHTLPSITGVHTQGSQAVVPPSRWFLPGITAWGRRERWPWVPRASRLHHGPAPRQEKAGLGASGRAVALGHLASARLLEFVPGEEQAGPGPRVTCRVGVGRLPFHTAPRSSAHGPQVYLTGRPEPRGPERPGPRTSKSAGEQAGLPPRSPPAPSAAALASEGSRPPCRRHCQAGTLGRPRGGEGCLGPDWG